MTQQTRLQSVVGRRKWAMGNNRRGVLPTRYDSSDPCDCSDSGIIDVQRTSLTRESSVRRDTYETAVKLEDAQTKKEKRVAETAVAIADTKVSEVTPIHIC